MDTKILSSEQIAKKVKVVDFTFTREGLWISYSLDGKEHELIANPEQTCDLLKKLGLIEDYSGSGDDVAVEFEFIRHGTDAGGEPTEFSGVQQSHWDEFAPGFELSQREAIDIAIGIEKDKAMDVEISKLLKIPSLVNKINNSKNKS